MIEVDRLVRRFGSTVALADVTFRVGPGEIVGFLGPNGAGKTTAMRILTGSLAPTSGSARIDGYDVQNELQAVRRRIGFMPEQVPLYGEDTVEAFLGFVADVKGVSRSLRTSQIEELTALCGLAKVRHRLVGHLSKGYRQRVGLAQALVGDPPVLILDEPTSGLDPNQIVEIRALIAGFRGRKTVLLSSHLLDEVARLCERVLILADGRVVAEERPEAIAGSLALKPRVALRWEGDRERVRAALAELAGVDDVLLTPEGAEVVIAGNPVEIRPRLVDSVLATGARLQGLEDRTPTLEDLFLRLTGGDRRSARPADEPAGARPGAEPEGHSEAQSDGETPAERSAPENDGGAADPSGGKQP
jgi:ABC-2 type transport system ATP-binding protein